MAKIKNEIADNILGKARNATIKEIKKILCKAEDYTFKRCPDQIVASLQKRDGKFCWSEKITTKKQKFFKRIDIVQESNVPDDNIILLILESPHKDEFAENNINGPAFGKTGININKYLKESLNKKAELQKVFPENAICKIIIMNAIQYACSLGLQLDVLKNSMLKKLWSENCIKENFLDRIKTILSATSEKEKRMVVINCCTKPIKKSVSLEIENLGIVKKIYEAPHPRSWTNDKKITINDIHANKKDNNYTHRKR